MAEQYSFRRFAPGEQLRRILAGGASIGITQTNVVEFPGAGPFGFEGSGFRRAVAQAAPSIAHLNSRSRDLRLSFHHFFDARVRQ